jgi:hypothetical protein
MNPTSSNVLRSSGSIDIKHINLLLGNGIDGIKHAVSTVFRWIHLEKDIDLFNLDSPQGYSMEASPTDLQEVEVEMETGAVLL